ncbi:MAG TPA: glutaredoxin family protein [Ferrovaceae bacterium]|nr:glutaredoxin family protein [Ferrovum sp. JA12]HQT80893.1 glutaredoxin family protein [Ferrovaceae bacterium]HQU06633.1 glutaredoxin family protein [Ferrovaceae bacterium]
MNNFLLLIRDGCHLCDNMTSSLTQHPLFNRINLSFLDIDNNDELHQQFFDKIPVLLKNNQIVCQTFFNEELFAKMVD